MNFLDQVVKVKQKEIEQLRFSPAPRRVKKLPRTGFVIAEIKKASPTRGRFAGDIDVVERALQFEQAGAGAISVLTDTHWFSGSFDDLRKVCSAVRAPVLMKDFIIDARQLEAGAAAGADMVLLIVRLLGERLRHMVRLARRLGLEPLVEVHSTQEVEIAVESGAHYIGVNSRNLDSLEVNPGIFELLSTCIAAFPEFIWVAESGFSTAKEVMHAFGLGYDGVLIGTRLNAYEDGVNFLKKICEPERM